MALFTCPDCKSDVSKSAAACPKCGRPVTEADRNRPETKRMNRWVKVGVAVLICFLVGGVLDNRDKRLAAEEAANSTASKTAADSSKKVSPCEGVDAQAWDNASTLWRKTHPECEPSE